MRLPGYHPPKGLGSTKASDRDALSGGVSAELPAMERFQAENARSFSDICRRVLGGSQAILSFLDGNRQLARMAGIEAMAVEVSGIIEGGRLQDLQDHLDYALTRNERAELTIENLSKLNRTERLLAEIHRAVAVLTGPLLPQAEVQAMHGLVLAQSPAPSALPAQPPAPRPSGESVLLTALLAITGASVTAILLVLLLSGGQD